eukprot:CAMPEP_0206274130 /NCGR_PEP_ID=MMETSP0047_2-20121206/34987_1 /ASSEMBLY_ACC=CAM_ASM_000192 /TAXON_ID=195065 /ORGANISM="Chroomonas mesostigmatica_cf, Strain CCMP1168" /LENGTH=61 /DNA_ID=CAMNT_0053703317 /DNA_START=122 /DNA_END=303 /DNA_ORIENTATION=-
MTAAGGSGSCRPALWGAACMSVILYLWDPAPWPFLGSAVVGGRDALCGARWESSVKTESSG